MRETRSGRGSVRETETIRSRLRDRGRDRNVETKRLKEAVRE